MHMCELAIAISMWPPGQVFFLKLCSSMLGAYVYKVSRAIGAARSRNQRSHIATSRSGDI